MKIGLFTDTYFPQVSGVATSIKTLRDQLTALGHQVYIFTTTDRRLIPFRTRRREFTALLAFPLSPLPTGGLPLAGG